MDHSSQTKPSSVTILPPAVVGGMVWTALLVVQNARPAKSRVKMMAL